MEPRPRLWIREEDMKRRVPQPLVTSLSLRNTWLLPGDIGIMTEYLRVGEGKQRGGKRSK
jgi:hypothetical protein